MKVGDTVIANREGGEAKAVISRIDDGDYYLKFVPSDITNELYPFGEEDLTLVEPDHSI